MYKPPSPAPLKQKQPLFNIPMIMLIFIALIIALHSWLNYISQGQKTYEFLIEFSFIPVLFSSLLQPSEFIELQKFSTLSILISLVSYSFLHMDGTHLLFNLIWLVIFGSPLSRHLGAMRFTFFWITTAILSALSYFLFNSMSTIPMIGASGVVSALMGAAARYGFYRNLHASLPLLSMRTTLQNNGVLMFVGIFIAVNLTIGFGLILPWNETFNIAWETHIGGLVSGFVLIGLFEKKEDCYGESSQ